MALRTSSGSERSRIPTNVPPTTGPNEDTTGIRDTDAPCFWSRTKLIGDVEGESMQNVAYVRIVREGGPLRLAYLPAEAQPVRFGVHGAVAEHYRVSPEVSEPHATTLDYIVAAAGG